jgi:hypothetical protein
VRGRKGAVEKHKIQETDLQIARIGKKISLEPPTVAPSSPPSTPSPSSPWLGESGLPLDYGIVEVTCIISIYVVH